MKAALREMYNGLTQVAALPVWVCLWTLAGPFYGFRSWAWNVYHHKQPGEWVFVIPRMPKGE